MLILYFYLISFSLVGYGLFVKHILKIDYLNIGIAGILGITLFSLISYFTSFFLIHNENFNLFFLLLGICLFIFFIRSKDNNLKEILLLLLILTILIIFIFVGKNHDDFPYYHFPYISLLTEYTHPLGLGKINNGFRSPSSIFFISSMLYLPGANFYLFHLTPAFIFCFSNYIFLKFILDKKIFHKERTINFLSLLSFCFINTFFYRLAEHGTDRSGMILIIISIIILLYLINQKNYSKFNSDLVKIFSILVFFVLSIKPFYLINLPFFLVLIYYEHTRKIFLNLFFSRSFFYCLFFLIFTIGYTFLNSGCFIFPIVQTCFENLAWSIDKSAIEDVKLWFELWSKSGARPGFVVENRLEYVSNFNWLPSWINNYFFNKMSDFLIGLIFLSLIIFFLFYKSSKSNLKINTNYKIIFFLINLILIEWFLYHPTLRYGGYHLFALIFFLPLSIFLKNLEIHFSLFCKRALILIMITTAIFIFRNSIRLDKEYKNYSYNPIKNTNYKFIGGNEEFFFRYQDHIDKNMIHYPKFYIFGREKFIIIK